MKRATAPLAGAVVLVVAAPAAAMSHELTGPNQHGRTTVLRVDAHLRPTFIQLPFHITGCGAYNTDHAGIEGDRFTVTLLDERMEHGTLHKHWRGGFQATSNGGRGTQLYGTIVVHVSRHPDGSIHAQGTAGGDAHGASHYGRSKLCTGGASFAVKS